MALVDLALIWADGEADLAIAGGDVVLDETPTTACIVSLFTDALATADQTPDADKRGWWGDGVDPADVRGGSLLWLLDRAKRRATTLADAELHAKTAMAWIVDDGHADAVDVTADFPQGKVLRLRVALTGAKAPDVRGEPTMQTRRIRAGTGARVVNADGSDASAFAW